MSTDVGSVALGPSPPIESPLDTLAVDRFVVDITLAAPARFHFHHGDALASHRHVALRFVSPFRLARPDALRVPGAGYLNADCFPAEHFLDRLLNRIHRVALGRNATREERAALAPPAAAVVAVPEHLF